MVTFSFSSSYIQVKDVVADFIGSIQTVVQQMTLFRLFSTCRLMVEAGHYFLRKCLRQSSVPGIAAKTTDADAASHIHPDMGDWEEVIFQLSDVNIIRVNKNRKAGAPHKDKTDFDKFLMGTTYNIM